MPQHKLNLSEYVRWMGGSRVISRVLIANNGIAAVKAIRSIKKWAYETLGSDKAIEFVAMATPEDLKANAEYIRLADEFVQVPGGSNNNNYANIFLIAEIAETYNCHAVWAGWGHASENPRLPELLEQTKNKVVWIGPPAHAMRALGDKIGSTLIAQSAGVPCMPWSGDGLRVNYSVENIPEETYRKSCVTTAEECMAVANRIGYPVMIKASEGGGGKGIRRVESQDQVAGAFRQVQGEVPGSPIFVMKLAGKCRHLEVQLLCDMHGSAIAVFGRDCSIQRRHQKIIEEGPVVAAPPHIWKDMERSAVRLAKEVGYVGAGTVEYLYMDDGSYYFLELNPRLQVEHPVTEFISGVNLPAAQLQIAMGIPLHRMRGIRRMFGEDVTTSTPIDFNVREAMTLPGHVIACRITAENPDEKFQPTSGVIHELHFRSTPDVWGYFSVGSQGGVHEYADSQFGHLFALGATREVARRNMVTALKELDIRGDIRTTIEYLQAILEDEDFKNNNISTTWLEQVMNKRQVAAEKPATMIVTCCGAIFRAHTSSTAKEAEYQACLLKGQLPNPKIYQGIIQSDVELIYEGIKYIFRITKSGPNSYDLNINGWTGAAEVYSLSDGGLIVRMDNKSYVVYGRDFPSGLRLIVNNKTCLFSVEYDPTQLRSAMQGKLVHWLVEDGAHVKKGQPVAEVEVMKMYVTTSAPEAGTIRLLKPEGTVMEAGDLIATLQLDDPNCVQKAEIFKGQFPPFADPAHLGPRKSSMCIRQAELKLEMLLNGWELGPGALQTTVDTIRACLQDPYLPVHQFVEHISTLSGRIPTDLYDRLQECVDTYRKSLDTANFERFNGKNPKPAKLMNTYCMPGLPLFPGSKLISIIEEYVAQVRKNAVPGTDPAKAIVTSLEVSGLMALLHKYSNYGNDGYAMWLVRYLISTYMDVEQHFQFSGATPDLVISQLRKELKNDVPKVAYVARAHHQLSQRTELISRLLNILSDELTARLPMFRDTLTSLSQLRGKPYASIVLKVRQLLMSLDMPSPTERIRAIEAVLSTVLPQEGAAYAYMTQSSKFNALNAFAVSTALKEKAEAAMQVLINASAGAEEVRQMKLAPLIDQSQPIEDLIFHFLRHSNPTFRGLAVEVYVRRVFQLFTLDSIVVSRSHSNAHSSAVALKPTQSDPDASGVVSHSSLASPVSSIGSATSSTASTASSCLLRQVSTDPYLAEEAVHAGVEHPSGAMICARWIFHMDAVRASLVENDFSHYPAPAESLMLGGSKAGITPSSLGVPAIATPMASTTLSQGFASFSSEGQDASAERMRNFRLSRVDSLAQLKSAEKESSNDEEDEEAPEEILPDQDGAEAHRSTTMTRKKPAMSVDKGDKTDKAGEKPDDAIRRLGVMAHFDDIGKLNNGFSALLSEFEFAPQSHSVVSSGTAEVPLHVLYVSVIWPDATSTDSNTAAADSNSSTAVSDNAMATHFADLLQKHRATLIRHGIRRVTFVVAPGRRPEEHPAYFTYRHAMDYAEDPSIRHIEPNYAMHMQLHRLSNFDFDFMPTTNRMVHLFAAIPKQQGDAKTGSKSRPNQYDGRRFFARVLVRRLDSAMLFPKRVASLTGSGSVDVNSMTDANIARLQPEAVLPSPTDALQSNVLPAPTVTPTDSAPETQGRAHSLDAHPETEFAFVEALNSLEVALANTAAGARTGVASASSPVTSKVPYNPQARFLFNHIFVNVLVEVVLYDIHYIEAVIRALTRRYADKIRRLNVTHVEFAVCVRTRPDSPLGTPCRFVCSNPTGYILDVKAYAERFDPTTGRVVLDRLDLANVDRGGVPAVLPPPLGTPLPDADAPYPTSSPLDKARLTAANMETIWVYDFIPIFEKAIRRSWRQHLVSLLQDVAITAMALKPELVQPPPGGNLHNASDRPPRFFQILLQRLATGTRTVLNDVQQAPLAKFKSFGELVSAALAVLDARKAAGETGQIPEQQLPKVTPFLTGLKNSPTVSLSHMIELLESFPQPCRDRVRMFAEAATSMPSSFLSVTELLLAPLDVPRNSGETKQFSEIRAVEPRLIESHGFKQRIAGPDSIGMVAWHLTARTVEYPAGRDLIVIANDITHQAGSFGPREDLLFKLASERARKLGIPRIYLGANSGARIGLADEVRNKFKIAWSGDDPSKGFQYLYLTQEDYELLKDSVVCTPVEIPEAKETRFVITDVVGRKDGLGVENLRGSGLIAGETSLAYEQIFTLTYVTGRCVGIGAYLARLGQRVIQKADPAQPLILTGYNALNKLLGRPVYTSNVQLGGPDIMHVNGVTHLTVNDDLEGCCAIVNWLSYVPAKRYDPLPRRDSRIDPVNRLVTFYPPKQPYDPRQLLIGQVKDHSDATVDPASCPTGLFDKGSWMEVLTGWAKGVVVGRARLGGIPIGVVAVETRTVEVTIPADPAGGADSKEQVVVSAGQVWYPDSAFKTAQAIRDMAAEDLPVMILANWRGFSGGMRDMFFEILKFGSYIVDALREHKNPVFVYIPPNGTLRGGAWVVVDPTINQDWMEMYADTEARGGILETDGTVDVKFRKDDILALMHSTDPVTIELDKKLAAASSVSKEAAQQIQADIKARETLLFPVYHQVATTFADLHDTPGRMIRKGCIDEVVPWKQARQFFYWRLALRLEEMPYIRELEKLAEQYPARMAAEVGGKPVTVSVIRELIQRWVTELTSSNDTLIAASGVDAHVQPKSDIEGLRSYKALLALRSVSEALKAKIGGIRAAEEANELRSRLVSWAQTGQGFAQLLKDLPPETLESIRCAMANLGK